MIQQAGIAFALVAVAGVMATTIGGETKVDERRQQLATIEHRLNLAADHVRVLAGCPAWGGCYFPPAGRVIDSIYSIPAGLAEAERGPDGQPILYCPLIAHTQNGGIAISMPQPDGSTIDAMARDGLISSTRVLSAPVGNMPSLPIAALVMALPGVSLSNCSAVSFTNAGTGFVPGAVVRLVFSGGPKPTMSGTMLFAAPDAIASGSGFSANDPMPLESAFAAWRDRRPVRMTLVLATGEYNSNALAAMLRSLSAAVSRDGVRAGAQLILVAPSGTTISPWPDRALVPFDIGADFDAQRLVLSENVLVIVREGQRFSAHILDGGPVIVSQGGTFTAGTLTLSSQRYSDIDTQLPRLSVWGTATIRGTFVSAGSPANVCAQVGITGTLTVAGSLSCTGSTQGAGIVGNRPALNISGRFVLSGGASAIAGDAPLISVQPNGTLRLAGATLQLQPSSPPGSIAIENPAASVIAVKDGTVEVSGSLSCLSSGLTCINLAGRSRFLAEAGASVSAPITAAGTMSVLRMGEAARQFGGSNLTLAASGGPCLAFADPLGSFVMASASSLSADEVFTDLTPDNGVTSADLAADATRSARNDARYRIKLQFPGGMPGCTA